VTSWAAVAVVVLLWLLLVYHGFAISDAHCRVSDLERRLSEFEEATTNNLRALERVTE
jgi:hypothetical protein